MRTITPSRSYWREAVIATTELLEFRVNALIQAVDQDPKLGRQYNVMDCIVHAFDAANAFHPIAANNLRAHYNLCRSVMRVMELYRTGHPANQEVLVILCPALREAQEIELENIP